MIKTRLLRLLAHARKYIAYNVGLQWLALVSQIVFVFALVQVLDGVLLGGAGLGGFVPQLVAACAAMALRFVCERAAAACSQRASMDVKRVLRKQIYNKVLHLGEGYVRHMPTSEVMQLSTEGVEQIETYFGRYLPQLFYSLLAPVTLFAVLAPVSPPAAGALLVCVPLIPASIVVVQKVAKRLLGKYWSVYASLGDSFLENLQGLVTLKVYQADQAKADQMDVEAERFRRITMKVLTMQLNSTVIMDVFTYGGAAIGMIVVARAFAAGTVPFAGALAIVLLSVEFFLPMRLLGSYFHIAMNGMAASDRIFRLLDAPEPEDAAAGDGDGAPAGQAAICMEGVRFSYGEAAPVVDGVSLVMPAGSLVSLVGESGCGKSTLASLLGGKLRGYQGSIAVGGRELRDIPAADLRRTVTVVRHDSHLFAGTVGQNLRMAKADASDQELLDLLSRVNLLDYLQGQGGLDARIDEGGANLSGGQRQRLALARALLHDTPVYVFDEATSNIDAESEGVIMAAVRELARTRTVLLISHRLANVVDSNQILLMSGGAIAERGTHAELMAAGGAYQRLFEAQRELEGFAHAGAGQHVVRLANQPKACVGEKNGAFAPVERPRRPGLSIMGRLIGLVRPLAPVMCLAVALGTVDFGCAISLSIVAVRTMAQVVEVATPGLGVAFVAIGVAAVARGVLHYAEQYCNHYIAFTLLAIVRHKVFAALRRLCPAKLEGRDKGDLISVLTSDIELLEVFYAHTISPIAIAVLVCGAMVAFLCTIHPAVGALALAAYVVVGVAIPFANGRRGREAGMRFRTEFGSLNAFVLDSVRGLEETLQYGCGSARGEELDRRSARLADCQRNLACGEGLQRATSNLAVLGFTLAGCALSLWLHGQGQVSLGGALVGTVGIMGSFGPVMALASLSNNLTQTLAAGERVLRVLDEEPVVEEVPVAGGVGADDAAGAERGARGIGASLEEVDFAYGEDVILGNVSLEVPAGKIVGIHGPSGSGKSTVLKLLMRFWDVDAGRVRVDGADVRVTPTRRLRELEGYATQETQLFHDSIAANIAIGRLDATREQIEDAARRASLRDFVCTLPDGYDTNVGELGSALSGGERQRIGIARAFLHDAPLLLLDEPTSNLDSLNEGVILRSLAQEGASRTVVLVSHRDSTMGIADTVLQMDSLRRS